MSEQVNDPRYHHDDGQEGYLAQRQDPLADVPDPRTYQERMADDHWQPVMQPNGAHRYDQRIEEFNRLHAERNGTVHRLPFEQRMAAHFQAAKDRELAAQGRVDDEANRLADAKPLLDKIDAAYQRLLAEKSNYDRRDFVRLQKARRQAESVGADLAVAEQFLAEVLAKEEAILDQRELDREARIAALQNELHALRHQRGQPAPPPRQDVVQPTFLEFWVALDEGRGHRMTPREIALRKYREQYGDE